MIDRTGKALAHARLSGEKLAALPGPSLFGKEQAYETQAEMVRELGLPVAGWKLGATSERAQAAVGTDEPFLGPMFEQWIYESPSRVPVPKGSMALVEAEIAYRFEFDLELDDGVVTSDMLAAAIDSVAPAIEIVDLRIEGGIGAGAHWLIADGGANHAFIHGPEQPVWSFADLDAVEVSVSMDGDVRGTGVGRNSLGGQLNALKWFAEALFQQGQTIRAGNWVTTGVIAPFFSGEIGVPIIADFGDLGQVEIALS